MTSIEETLAGPLRDRTEIVSAYAGTYPNVVLGGVPQFAYWNDHVYAALGEPVTVARTISPSGVASNTVIGRVGRPGATEGTVVSADGTSAVVNAAGTQVTAAYNSALALAAGDTVRLIWQGRLATVMAKLTSYVAPPVQSPGTTAPPPATATGSLPVFATDSATWSPQLGVWNAWGNNPNQKVFQGSYDGYTMYGAWFYNGGTRQLAGATVGAPQLRVPKRLSVGNYNADGVLHVYVHSNDTRPDGDVARVSGPYDITIPAHWQGDFVTLPQGAAEQLKNGGGIAIAGEPYAGFVGKAEDPSSGQLIIPWSR